MKKRIIVFVAAGLLILTAGLLFFHTDSVPSSEGPTEAAPAAQSSLSVPRFTTPVEALVSESGAEPPVFVESENPSVRTFAPEQVLEEKITRISSQKMLRRRLVRVPGKYPDLLYTERLQRNEEGAFWVSSQIGMVADQLIVKLSSDQSESDLIALVSEQGFSLVRKLDLPGHYLIDLGEASLDAVNNARRRLNEGTGLLALVEPNYIVSQTLTPNDPQYASLWAMTKIQAPAAWDITTGNSDVLVAIIDSGIDASHADLADNLWVNPGETGTDTNGDDKKNNGIDDDGNGKIDDWQGWDFHNNDNDPDDDNKHGTHVAGTIGAVGNNNTAVAGICWDVSLVGIKFLGADGFGSSADAIDAVQYAVTIGADVQNNSWGGGGSSGGLEEAIKNSNSNGVLFVAAAGNENSNNDNTPFYPASYDVPNIISVAATDQNDKLASFSNFGADSVDLAAPGVAILSTIPGGGTEELQGTSMAAPHVAGAAALLKSANSALSHLDIKGALFNSVDKISALTGKMVTGGRLNLDVLMEAADDADGDGMSDSWEIANGLNPNNPVDAEFDLDNDFLTNLEEYQNGTDPNDPDTDNDSLVDGWEVRYGFSPLSQSGQLDSVERIGFGTGGNALDLVVTNGYAYIADGENGLVIVDVSNPLQPHFAGIPLSQGNPSVASTYDTDGLAQGIAVQTLGTNTYAYIADGSNGLVVVDVTDPSNPDFKDEYETEKTAKSVAVKGDYAYVVGGAGGFVVIDVSDPENLSLAGGVYNILPELNDIFISGDFAYLSADNSTIYKYSISTPTAPSWSDSAPLGAQKNILGLHGNATHLFAAADDGTVKILNMSTMTYLAEYETDVSPLDTFVFDGMLYIATGAGGLEIATVTNPSNPDHFGTYPTYGGGNAVFAEGDYIYMADGTSGLQIFFIAFDEDFDGMLDSWEVANGLNPAFDDSALDPDSDGIINWGEYLARLNPQVGDQDATNGVVVGDGLIDGYDEVQTYNTDPRTPDTDGDGIDDKDEIDGTFGHITDPLNPDTDGDGMPDGWEVDNGLNPIVDDSNGDLDSDGLSNGDEYDNGTDPNDSDTDNDGLPDGWEVDNGLDPLTDDSALDPDSDGLTNLQEYTLGTDPQDPDTDADGMPDGWEVDESFDPLNPADALLDADSDDLNNLLEYNLGTDPHNPDSDSDGMPDGWEVNNGLQPSSTNMPHGANHDPDGDGLLNIQEYSLTSSSLWQSVYTSVTGAPAFFWFSTNGVPGSTDPRDVDSDSDGLSDYFEITTNAAITNLYITDPNNWDTDGDGLPDGWEVEQGTNSPPTVPALPTDDSDGDGLSNGEEETLGTQPYNSFDPIFVDDDGPGDVLPFGWPTDPEMSDPLEDGSILHPFDAIVEAVTSTNIADGMTILLNDGLYFGIGNYNIDLAGLAITIRSWNGRDLTTVTSLGAGPTFLFSSGETTNTVLMDLTIKGNKCNSSDGDCDELPIITISNASPVITGCTIQETGGNAVQCSGASQPQFLNCIVADARNGFWIENGAAPQIVSNTVRDCFINNYFPMNPDDVTGDEYWGNGIYAINSGGITIQNTLIEQCDGRGLFVIGDPALTLSNSVIQSSWGGLRFSGVNAVLSRCQIQNNEAPNYYAVDGTTTKGLIPVPVELEDVEDVRHENENGAGILLTDGCEVFMQNTLMNNNRTWAVDPNWPTADDGSIEFPELRGPDYGLGGGIYVGADCFVTNVNMTLVDNTSMTRGGGASNHEQLFMRNLISWGNVASNMYVADDNLTAVPVNDGGKYQGIHCRSGHVTIWRGNIWYPYYSESSLYSLAIIVTSDPLFVGGGDYHLTTNSPGIDIGSPVMAPSNDLDGVTRPLDGNGDSYALYDLGAYEYVSSSSPSPLADEDGDGMSNGDEWIAGTDWEDPDDFFSVTTTYDANGPSTLVIWNSATQRVYTVQTTTNLLTAPWEPVVPGWTNNGTGSVLIYTNTYSDTPRYFQVDVWLATP